MKALIGFCSLIFVGVAGWQLGGRLSSDAIGMALGVLFGIMAGIPAALMVLAARRHEVFDEEPRRPRRQQQPAGFGAYPQFQQSQPPVIVVTGQGVPGQMGPGQGGYPQSGYQQGYDPSYGQAHGHPSLMQPNQMQLPGPVDAVPQRQFRVVGESDEIIDSW